MITGLTDKQRKYAAFKLRMFRQNRDEYMLCAQKAKPLSLELGRTLSMAWFNKTCAKAYLEALKDLW
jgi:hypothetical protein